MGLSDDQKAKLRAKYDTGNPALDALRRNVSGRVESGEAEAIVGIPAGGARLTTAERGQRIRDGRYKAAINRATRLGKEAGEGAGSWVIDGNTSTEAARRILQGYEDGDPEIMDIQPSPLSGEWADGPFIGDVLRELGVREGSDIESDVLDAYEAGYSEGFWDEVQRAARYQVGES